MNPTITTTYFNDWYDQLVEATRYYGQNNSFVAPHPNYEFQVDLFFISDLENQTNTIGIACIDIFTRYASIVPIKTKPSTDFLAGLQETLTNMTHKPQVLYSDNEGSLNSKDVLEYLEKVSK